MCVCDSLSLRSFVSSSLVPAAGWTMRSTNSCPFPVLQSAFWLGQHSLCLFIATAFLEYVCICVRVFEKKDYPSNNQDQKNENTSTDILVKSSWLTLTHIYWQTFVCMYVCMHLCVYALLIFFYGKANATFICHHWTRCGLKIYLLSRCARQYFKTQPKTQNGINKRHTYTNTLYLLLCTFVRMCVVFAIKNQFVGSLLNRNIQYFHILTNHWENRSNLLLRFLSTFHLLWLNTVSIKRLHNNGSVCLFQEGVHIWL